MKFYTNLSLWIIAFWQIVSTFSFTSTQMLLPVYFDSLNINLLIGGIIISFFFAFWFLISPLAGIISDEFGRKWLLIGANIVSSLGYVGLSFFSDPIGLLFSNSIVGLGSSLGVGSAVALWTDNVPKSKTTESMGYYNIVLGIGGGLGVFLGAILYDTLWKDIFLVFALLLFITGVFAKFTTDNKQYKDITMQNIYKTIMKRSTGDFFLSRSVIQVSIHWVAFSAVIGLSTYLELIVARIVGENISIFETNVTLLLLGAPVVLLLPLWGKLADSRLGNRKVLVIGLVGCVLLCIDLFVITTLNLIPGLLTNPFEIDSLGVLLIIFVLGGTAIAILPSSMGWIIERVGEDDLAKIMSVRQMLIGIGTIIGVMTGGIILGLFDVSLIFIAIIIYLVISAVILL